MAAKIKRISKAKFSNFHLDRCKASRHYARMKIKRGQATIWIIVAIILVAAIFMVFIFVRKPEIIGPPGSDTVFDLQSSLEQCANQHVNTVVNRMLPQGGFSNPENSVFYNNTNIEYLCKNIGFYEPCIQQHPMFLREMEEEIENYLLPRIISCFDLIAEEIAQRDGEITFEGGPPLIDVDLGPDRIFVDIEKKATVTKREEVRRFEKFEVVIKNPLYNLGSVAVEIAAQEAQYCHFEYVGYSVLYPRYVVTKYVMSDPTKIYTIRDTSSGKEMNIAIRSCAIPAGF